MKYRLQSQWQLERQRTIYVLDRWDESTETYSLAKPIEFTEQKEGEVTKNIFHIKEDHQDEGVLRAIFDGLWAFGMRPDGYENNDRQIKAMNYHLEDMRKLVFKDNI